MKDDSELNIRKTQHLSQEVYDSMMPTTVMFYF